MVLDQPAYPRTHAVRLPTLLQVVKLIANSMDPDHGRKHIMLVLSWRDSILLMLFSFLNAKFLVFSITCCYGDTACVPMTT
jgi:hypothetical protein